MSLLIRFGRVSSVMMAVILSLSFLSADGQQATPAATPTIAPVVREVLVSGMPAEALGQELSLVRYTIAPGTTLAAHTHPGMQIAEIESGVLHYVVVSGGAIQVNRGQSLATPAASEALQPGQETDLYPGDSVVETEGIVHYGANLGDEPVVILASTLLTAGAPPATVADLAATPTAGQ